MTTRSEWRPVLAYAGLSAANQMLWLTFTPLTSDAQRYYGVSSGAIGWLAEIFPLVYVVLALPTGRLVDRNLGRYLGLGAVLTAIGAIIRLDGHEFAFVLAGQVLIAVAQPFVLNAITKLSGSYLAPQDRATGIAVSSAGIFAGMVLALLLGAALGGHRIGLLLSVQAALAVAAAGYLCIALRAPVRDGVASTVPGPLREVWADHRLRLLTGLISVGFGVFIALTTWLQKLLEPAGVSETAAGYLLLAMVLAGVVGSALIPQRLARRNRELAFVLASVVIGATGCVVLATVPGLWTGLVVLLAVGAVLLTDLPVVLEMAERWAGNAGATATAMIWLAGNAAGLVAALLVQTLLHHPAVAFIVLAAILAGGAGLMAPLRTAARTAPRSRNVELSES